MSLYFLWNFLEMTNVFLFLVLHLLMLGLGLIFQFLVLAQLFESDLLYESDHHHFEIIFQYRQFFVQSFLSNLTVVGN